MSAPANPTGPVRLIPPSRVEAARAHVSTLLGLEVRLDDVVGGGRLGRPESDRVRSTATLLFELALLRAGWRPSEVAHVRRVSATLGASHSRAAGSLGRPIVTAPTARELLRAIDAIAREVDEAAGRSCSCWRDTCVHCVAADALADLRERIAHVVVVETGTRLDDLRREAWQP